LPKRFAAAIAAADGPVEQLAAFAAEYLQFTVGGVPPRRSARIQARKEILRGNLLRKICNGRLGGNDVQVAARPGR
jgi:hypothetical protein